VIASGLYRPNGVAFKNGTLYIAELSKISKIDKIEDNLDNPPKPTVINDNFQRTKRTAGSSLPSGRTTSFMLRSDNPATTCCTTMRTAKSAG